MLKKIIHCQKHQEQSEALGAPPMPGPTGEKILNHICSHCWSDWLTHQTLLINEYRLSLINPEARKFLNTEREKFLFGPGSEKPSHDMESSGNMAKVVFPAANRPDRTGYQCLFELIVSAGSTSLSTDCG